MDSDIFNNNEVNPKQRRLELSGKQVLYASFFILTTIFTGGGLGCYSFVDQFMERTQLFLGCLLFLSLWTVFYFGPRNVIRTVFLILLSPSFLFTFIGGISWALGDLNVHPNQSFAEITADGTTFKLVSFYDISYYDYGKYGTELIQEKYTLHGTLKKTNNLISVLPTDGARIMLIEGGKRIRFTTPKLAGRKELVRYYETDFANNSKLKEETIRLTGAEQR